MEMLVSIAILSIILLVLFGMLQQVANSLRYTNSKIDEFGKVRAAFESISERLGQSTLNAYWDYNKPMAPTQYIRQAELRFVCGGASGIIDTPVAHTEQHYTDAVFFQAPLGLVTNSTNGVLKNLLNSWGYLVEYGPDTNFLPTFFGGANATTRFRLLEFTEPSENLAVYQYTSGLTGTTPLNLTYATNPPLTGLNVSSQFTPAGNNGREWFLNSLYTSGTTHVAADKIHVLADNVIALILLPKLSLTKDPTGTALAPNYNYDSTGDLQTKTTTSTITTGDLTEVNQLPPIVQVTMVAIDEASAKRLSANTVALGAVQAALQSPYFQLSASYTSDLANLQSLLVADHLNFRIFTTDVYIKEAKWSRN